MISQTKGQRIEVYKRQADTSKAIAKRKRSWSTFSSGGMGMAKKSWLIERLEAEGYNFDPISMTKKRKSKKKKVKKSHEKEESLEKARK
jgi:hypothetical protein